MLESELENIKMNYLLKQNSAELCKMWKIELAKQNLFTMKRNFLYRSCTCDKNSKQYLKNQWQKKVNTISEYKN